MVAVPRNTPRFITHRSGHKTGRVFCKISVNEKNPAPDLFRGGMMKLLGSYGCRQITLGEGQEWVCIR